MRSRPTRPGLVLRNEPFAPRALAEAVGQALSARAGNKSVKAEIDIAADLPAMVVGDVLRLRAALENLADNAVKFTSQGAVTFRAGAEPATRGRLRLIFTLTDSGIGMSAAEIKRLFQAVCAGERGHRPAIWRCWFRADVRQADRQGDGR